MNFYFISFIFLYNFIHINSEKDICEIGANKECSKSNGNKYSKGIVIIHNLQQSNWACF